MSAITAQGSSRKYIQAEKKLMIVNESFELGKQVAKLARKYKVAVNAFIKWRKQALCQAASLAFSVRKRFCRILR